jgi:hypothetical protein
MGACARPTVTTLYLCETSTAQGHLLAEGWYYHKEFLPLWRSKRYTIAKYWFRKLKNVLLSMTVLLKNTVIRVSKTDCGGEVCEAVVSEWSQLDGPEKREKGKQCCFSMHLTQMHRFTLICCKIQRCLTLQRKRTLSESYDFLVIVNKGQYFSRVCQIPNYTLLYCPGTALCGDVKYLAK